MVVEKFGPPSAAILDAQCLRASGFSEAIPADPALFDREAWIDAQPWWLRALDPLRMILIIKNTSCFEGSRAGMLYKSLKTAKRQDFTLRVDS